MTQQTYSLTTGVIFLAIAILHLVRLVLGWRVFIAGAAMPLWASWMALIFAGFLAYQGIGLSRRA